MKSLYIIAVKISQISQKIPVALIGMIWTFIFKQYISEVHSLVPVNITGVV